MESAIIWPESTNAGKLSNRTSVADPDRCHGLHETYEKCQPKFNTIYKFCSYQKQRTR